MKKILFLLLLLITACSKDDEPVFQIDNNLKARFEQFAEIASYFDVVIPRNNMVLRFITPTADNTNDSKAYIKNGQLFIDIDQGFVDLYSNTNGGDNYMDVIIYQQLANGLLGTEFKDCGIMKKIIHPADMPLFDTLDYSDYPPLFDPEAPC